MLLVIRETPGKEKVGTPVAAGSGRFRVVHNREQPPLRVLIANEQGERLKLIAGLVTRLGHSVVASESDPEPAAAAIARERPDVALVGLSGPREPALDLVGRIAAVSACPVIVMLPRDDADLVGEAARRGAFAFIAKATPDDLRSVIDITMHRFAEYNNLQSAFERRAIIEQAKGILMARHSIAANAAFDMLRDSSQRTGEKLTEVAAAIVNSHLLLSPTAVAAERAD
jgi:response regulator NasT